MKGINNRQKMIVVPRKIKGEKNQSNLNLGKKDMAHKKRFGLQKSLFRKKTI